MGKRANNQSAKSTSKKVKVNPALAAIGHVIMQAESLPDRCRTMLVDMLPFSLGVASDERHKSQTWAVDAVEQTLNAQKFTLEAVVVEEEVKLVNLKASEDALVNTAKDAQAAFDAQKEVVQNAQLSLSTATEAADAASNILSTAQAEQAAGESKLASTQEEKATLEAAFEAHFNSPMQEGSGPHFKELQPFLKTIQMDDSLLKSAPSCCTKSREDRGSFDEVVLKELEKALTSKIAALGDAVATETAALVERKASTEAAEVDCSTKKVHGATQATALEVAQKENCNLEAVLMNVNKAVEEFQPQVSFITDQVDKAKLACANFEAGPLTSFTTYSTRVTASAEVATAGA